MKAEEKAVSSYEMHHKIELDNRLNLQVLPVTFTSMFVSVVCGEACTW